MDHTGAVDHDDRIFLDRARAGEVHPFGHREHLRLAFVAAKVTDGRPAAVAALCEEAIRRLATHAGHPDKLHVTITTAWATLVTHHVGEAPSRTFEELLVDEPRLSDSGTLLRHYSRERLSEAQARKAWVEPDRAPLPGR